MSASLVCDGRVVSTVEVADTFLARLRGLLGRSSLEGAFLLTPASSVHTFGMQFPIDVAFIADDLLVLDVVTVKPYGLTRPRRHARAVVEAPAGAFADWGVRPGCKLEVRP